MDYGEPSRSGGARRIPVQAGDVLGADVTLNIDADVPREALEALADRFHVDVVVHCDDPRFATLAPHVRVRVRQADEALLDACDGGRAAAADTGGPVAVPDDGESSDSAEPGSLDESDGPVQDDIAWMPGPRRAIISMDSTSADAESLFRAAISSVEALPGTQVEGISPLYHVSNFDGPDAMAAVIQAQTRLAPRRLIAALQDVERAHGDAVDLDVVDVDGVTSDEPDCRVPWPSASFRAAVLAPWLDMDPDARLGNDPVAFLLAMAPDSGRVGMLSDNWIIGGTA